jgi:hypothetical protein
MTKKNNAVPPAQPNRWHTEQWWRHPFPGDPARARALRHLLHRARFYPASDLAERPHLDGWEANSRATLPDMLAELDRTDVIAVADMVRLLALVPREPHFFRKRWRSRPR